MSTQLYALAEYFSKNGSFDRKLGLYHLGDKFEVRDFLFDETSKNVAREVANLPLSKYDISLKVPNARQEMDRTFLTFGKDEEKVLRLGIDAAILNESYLREKSQVITYDTNFSQDPNNDFLIDLLLSEFKVDCVSRKRHKKLGINTPFTEIAVGANVPTGELTVLTFNPKLQVYNRYTAENNKKNYESLRKIVKNNIDKDLTGGMP